MNIIGDIAGQYDVLMRLMEKVPDEEFLFLGDLVDRGPASPDVLDFAIKNNIKCLMGNHEHMMIDYYRDTRIYHGGIWIYNGGLATYRQYEEIYGTVLEKHLTWLESLPTYYEEEDFIVTHAPISGYDNDFTIAKHLPLEDENSLIWNRDNPRARDKLQIFGHNGIMYADKDLGFMCIDDSNNSKLTCYNTNTKQIYQEPYDK